MSNETEAEQVIRSFVATVVEVHEIASHFDPSLSSNARLQLIREKCADTLRSGNKMVHKPV